MSALFPRWSNTAFRLLLLALVCLVPVGLAGAMGYVRTPWNTGVGDAIDQPVMFDHRHHVIDDEIDCIYCHTGAESSDFAGVPATDVCMGCHAQIWNESPLLETVRRSYFSGQAVPWNRVHDLPDFVYFNHAVHVQRGVGCVTCHGRVDRMARVYPSQDLSMGFCVDCHAKASELSAVPVAASPGSRFAASPGSRAAGGDMFDPEAVDGVAQPALFGSVRPNENFEASLGPERHDSLTTCTACHR